MMDDSLKYELLSFCSLTLLPLAIVFRLAIDEHIFQKWKTIFNKDLRDLKVRIVRIEMWLQKMYELEYEKK